MEEYDNNELFYYSSWVDIVILNSVYCEDILEDVLIRII